MVWQPDDLLYDTREMIERIRPKQRYDIAIVFVAAVLALALVWAADSLQPHAIPPFLFIKDAHGVVVGNTHTGDVAVCNIAPNQIVRSENDSANDAVMRQLYAELDLD